MELIYAIAAVLGAPNERVIIDKTIKDCAWFHVENGAHSLFYSCRTVRKGKFLKKNSIRID